MTIPPYPPEYDGNSENNQCNCHQLEWWRDRCLELLAEFGEFRDFVGFGADIPRLEALSMSIEGAGKLAI